MKMSIKKVLWQRQRRNMIESRFMLSVYNEYFETFLAEHRIHKFATVLMELHKNNIDMIPVLVKRNYGSKYYHLYMSGCMDTSEWIDSRHQVIPINDELFDSAIRGK